MGTAHACLSQDTPEAEGAELCLGVTILSSHHSVTTALKLHLALQSMHHFLYSPSVAHPVIRCPLAHWRRVHYILYLSTSSE